MRVQSSAQGLLLFFLFTHFHCSFCRTVSMVEARSHSRKLTSRSASPFPSSVPSVAPSSPPTVATNEPSVSPSFSAVTAAPSDVVVEPTTTMGWSLFIPLMAISCLVWAAKGKPRYICSPCPGVPTEIVVSPQMDESFLADEASVVELTTIRAKSGEASEVLPPETYERMA